jgi:hypothetical protein
MTLVSDDAEFRHRPYPFASRIEQFMRLDKDGQHARAIIADSKIDRIEIVELARQVGASNADRLWKRRHATQKSQAL